MATVRLILDKRVKYKGDKLNLSLIVTVSKPYYFPITKITEAHYELIFEKKSLDKSAVDLRKKCNDLLSRGEEILAGMRVFNKDRFKQLLWDKDSLNNGSDLPKTLELNVLFDYYIEHKTNLATYTKRHCRTSRNIFETYCSGLTVWDITPDFLRKFEKYKLENGCKLATVSSYLRDLKCIINYFMYEVEIIPKDYVYPFKRGGYSIKNYFPKKLVMSAEDIEKVINYNDFDCSEQEYARNIWLILYYSNGINFIDLLRMKWSHIEGDFMIFFRKKTENTRKSNIREITVHLSPHLMDLINKVGDPTSKFVLGYLDEGYTEQDLVNKKDNLRAWINGKLTELSKKLELSVPLKMKTARDCYATTLLRAGVSKDKIGISLGHSNSGVTEHYLDTLNIEDMIDINKNLVIGNLAKNPAKKSVKSGIKVEN